MPTDQQAPPSPTVTNVNQNIDSLLSKLRSRISSLADRIGGAQPVSGSATNDTLKPASTPNLVDWTKSHQDGLNLAHSDLDRIEAALG